MNNKNKSKQIISVQPRFRRESCFWYRDSFQMQIISRTKTSNKQVSFQLTLSQQPILNYSN